MTFALPYLAILGILAFLLYTLDFYKILRTQNIVLPSGANSGGRSRFKHFLFLFAILAWGLITLGLMQPRMPAGFAKDSIKVNDIFFVVDVSRSMLAEDFRPNRLEAAKRKISEFADLRPTDRIGLVMFSEKAFTLLPLSTDLKLIKRMIEDIRVGVLGLGYGTNIGDALGLAVGRATQSLAENKVIILLTDGVSNVGSMTPIQAAEEAKEQKVKVYTIGIGKKADSKVLRSGLGGRGSYQRIPGGSVDFETLKKIAEITNGKSFFAESSGALEAVLGEIQKLEKTEIETSAKIIYKELYLRYLIPGVLLFIFIELLRRYGLREAV